MAKVRLYNQLEAGAVQKFREVYSARDAYRVLLINEEDRENIKRLAAESLYPEEPEIAFEPEEKGNGEEAFGEAGHGMSKSRQRDALLFHLSAEFYGEKNVVRMICCGGVDDGKSTIIGRILYETAARERKYEIQNTPEYLRKDGTVDYAILAGMSKEEASQGITVHVSYSRFDTEECGYLMADVPGHEEYTGNMAHAAREAELAVLTVSANKGIVSQTRRHARICYFMGIRKIIFVINKMDMTGFDREMYGRIAKEISHMMQEYPKCGYQIIPVAAKAGDNIVRRKMNMPWYQGDTLLEAMTRIHLKEGKEGPFYMAVQKICKSSQIPGKEIKKRVILGQGAEGKVSKGQELLVYPTMERARVSRLYFHLREVEEIEGGQPVALELDRELDVARGYFLAEEDIFHRAECVEADVLWVGDDQLRFGIRYKVKIAAKEVTAVVAKILYRVDVNDGDHKYAESVTKNGLARVELRFSEPVACACEKDSRVLGTLELLDKKTDMLLGYGNIVKTVSDEIFMENSQKVTRQEREEALGQKAGIILFPEKEGIDRWMNYVERYLLHMGLHTLLAGSREDNIRITRIAEAGLLGLLSADEALLPDFMWKEPCRICDLREEEFLQENMVNILKKVKLWVAGILY